MYFKEFSCNQAENMQARCMPRFIQHFPNFYGKLTACSVSCAPFLRGEEARRERSGVGRHAAAQPPHGEARSASNALCMGRGVLRSGEYAGVGKAAAVADEGARRALRGAKRLTSPFRRRPHKAARSCRESSIFAFLAISPAFAAFNLPFLFALSETPPFARAA